MLKLVRRLGFLSHLDVKQISSSLLKSTLLFIYAQFMVSHFQNDVTRSIEKKYSVKVLRFYVLNL
jgi:hypothetical protein